MIVCVESNFVLELAFLQEEHVQALAILQLAEAGKVSLVLPAFSIGEPYEGLVRRAKKRRALQRSLLEELAELARSKPFESVREDYEDITGLLISSAEDEKQRLDESLARILGIATVIPLTREVFLAAIQSQTGLKLGPQDSIVFASMEAYLREAGGGERLFITRNPKDFDNPDIQDRLAGIHCRLLSRFEAGLGYIQSRLTRAS